MWDHRETFSVSLHTGLRPHLGWKCLPGRVYKSGRIAQYNTEYNKMAIYCPQGSGTLRQQLLMMHDIAWYCMVWHGMAWYYIVLHGIAWYHMVLHGIALYCMVSHGIAWNCMVFHGITWYCMVLLGIV